MLKQKLYIYILPILILQACKSDKPDTGQDGPPIMPEKKVWVINEGNFQFGNASIGIYSPKDSLYSAEVFKAVNKRPLGDVLQSMNIIDGKAYLVINNSQKIEVMDTEDYERISVITGFDSPRYILPVSNAKAYVTDLYSHSIQIIDPETGQLSGSVPAEGWTDKMVLSNNKLFVTMPHHDYVYVVDVSTDEPLDSIKLADTPNSMAEDNTGLLWVLCGGKPSENQATLFAIDPVSLEIKRTIPLGQKTGASNLCIAPDGISMYFLSDGVYSVNIGNGEVSSQPVIASQGGNFYGLGIDPDNGDIYVADARDYTQRGRVYRYSKDRVLLDEFEAGIIPGGFFFE